MVNKKCDTLKRTKSPLLLPTILVLTVPVLCGMLTAAYCKNNHITSCGCPSLGMWAGALFLLLSFFAILPFVEDTKDILCARKYYAYKASGEIIGYTNKHDPKAHPIIRVKIAKQEICFTGSCEVTKRRFPQGTRTTARYHYNARKKEASFWVPALEPIQVDFRFAFLSLLLFSYGAIILWSVIVSL